MYMQMLMSVPLLEDVNILVTIESMDTSAHVMKGTD